MSLYMISRRKFLHGTSLALAACVVSPVLAEGGQGKKEAGRKSNVVFDNYSGHYSLRGVTPILTEYRIPTGGNMDPEKWILKYDMRICEAGRGPAEKMRSPVRGTLTLEKVGNKYTMLHAVQNGPESVVTETAITAGDGLTLGWTAKRLFVLQNGTLPAFEETATIADKTVRMSGWKKMDSLSLSGVLVSFPQLVNAMAGKTVPPSFAFLDEQCAVRDEQAVKTAGKITVSCASGKIGLSGFQQNGRGTHPVHYWLDERGAPIFITRGLRSYVLTSIG